MATPTYTAIASITLGSSASSVTFSSIPQDYRDLVLVVAGSSNSGGVDSVGLQFNSDTGSNYFRVVMQGNGSSTASSTQTSTSLNLGLTTTSVDSNIFQIMDYSATDKHKTVLARANTTTSFVRANAGRWADTSAIETILVNAGAADFNTGCTLALYGIEA